MRKVLKKPKDFVGRVEKVTKFILKPMTLNYIKVSFEKASYFVCYYYGGYSKQVHADPICWVNDPDAEHLLNKYSKQYIDYYNSEVQYSSDKIEYLKHTIVNKENLPIPVSGQ